MPTALDRIAAHPRRTFYIPGFIVFALVTPRIGSALEQAARLDSLPSALLWGLVCGLFLYGVLVIRRGSASDRLDRLLAATLGAVLACELVVVRHWHLLGS